MDIYEMPFAQRLKQKQQIEDRFRRICNLGNIMEPPPIKTPGKRGHYKRTKGRNLVERLIKQQDAVLAFAFNEQVPFTNNLAERDIRPDKIKQKISNSFRSFEGAEIYARIEGFISNARKNNMNIFNQLCSTFEEAKANLPFSDTRDFEEADKGFIAGPKSKIIMADAGHVAWDLKG